MEQIKQFLLNLITRGRYEAYDIETIRKIILFNIITAMGIVVLFVLGTFVYYNNIKYIWLIDYSITVILLLNLLYTQRSQNYRFGLYVTIGVFTFLS